MEGGHRGYTRQVLPASCSAAPRNPVAVPPSFFRLTLLRGVQPSDHVEGTSTGDTEAILALIKLPSMADDGRASCRLPQGCVSPGSRAQARAHAAGPGPCSLNQEPGPRSSNQHSMENPSIPGFNLKFRCPEWCGSWDFGPCVRRAAGRATHKPHGPARDRAPCPGRTHRLRLSCGCVKLLRQVLGAFHGFDNGR